MKKLIVIFLIASFAAFGSVSFASVGPTKTKSDSTMTKKMPKKGAKTSSKKMTKKMAKSSKKGKWSKSKKMSAKKKSSAKKVTKTSEPKEN